MRSCFYKMVPWPSGKARVCKTLIRQFKSGRYLQKKRTPNGVRFYFFNVCFEIRRDAMITEYPVGR